MRIAICDDEKAQQLLLQKYLAEWAESAKIMLKTELFASSEEFSFTWEEDRAFDLLVLDIEMRAANGMELARRIRMEDDLYHPCLHRGTGPVFKPLPGISALPPLLPGQCQAYLLHLKVGAGAGR